MKRIRTHLSVPLPIVAAAKLAYKEIFITRMENLFYLSPKHLHQDASTKLITMAQSALSKNLVKRLLRWGDIDVKYQTVEGPCKTYSSQSVRLLTLFNSAVCQL